MFSTTLGVIGTTMRYNFMTLLSKFPLFDIIPLILISFNNTKVNQFL